MTVLKKQPLLSGILILFMLAMIFANIGSNMYGSLMPLYLKELGSSIPQIGLFFTVSQIVPLFLQILGGWLAGSYGFKLMLLVAGIFYFIAAIIRFGMAREAARGGASANQRLSFDSLKSNLRTMFGLMVSGGLITWILITDGFRDVSFQLSENLFPVYMHDIGGLTIQHIGWVNSLFGLCMMLITIPGGWLSDKAGERIGFASGMVLMASALLLLINIPQGNIWLYYAGWAVAGMGVGIMMPAYQSLISKAVPQKLRGMAFGLFSTSLGIVSLPSPWLGAQLWDRVSPQFPFTVTAIALLFSIIPIWLKFKLPKANEDLQTEDPAIVIA